MRKTIHQCKIDKWQVFEHGAKRTAKTVDSKKGIWKKYPWQMNCKNDIKMYDFQKNYRMKKYKKQKQNMPACFWIKS